MAAYVDFKVFYRLLIRNLVAMKRGCSVYLIFEVKTLLPPKKCHTKIRVSGWGMGVGGVHETRFMTDNWPTTEGP
jgi:hypothetical protein